MQHTLHDRTLALAGIFQAIKLVQQIARTGMVDSATMETSVKSLFSLDSESPEAVFGNSINLHLGFETLVYQLGGNTSNSNKKNFNTELTKYLINVLVLERRLSKRNDYLAAIAKGIEAAQIQVGHFSYTHDNVMANIADIYSNTVSKLKPRVLVNGEHNHLQNTSNANKIRALLLAAIRAAVLWRQCGGTRWQVLLKRNSIIEVANEFLQTRH